MTSPFADALYEFMHRHPAWKKHTGMYHIPLGDRNKETQDRYQALADFAALMDDDLVAAMKHLREL